MACRKQRIDVMKVFCETPPGLSRAMSRVVAAMKKFAPTRVQFVNNPKQSDLIVLHVIGYPETVDSIKHILDAGKKYIVIQYCMRSTQRPNTADWLPIWVEAEMVWSYYDLHELIVDDGHNVPKFNFYRSPFGADPAFLDYDMPIRPRWADIMTSGYVAESETVGEVVEATRRLGHRMIHLGPPSATRGRHVTTITGVSDTDLASYYAQCWRVAGLRRCEGFEMPAVEGLACGARPVMFDSPHYRAWFNEFAEFIPEGSVNDVTDALTALLRQPPNPVTDDERRAAMDRFDWARIINGFWAGVK
jgi:hypothetical protein